MTDTPLTINQGSTFSLPATLKDAAGAARDLTGATVRFTLRTRNYKDVIHEATGAQASPGGAISFNSPATDGKFTLTIPAATTAAFDFDTGAYVFEVTWADSTVERVLEGTITFSRRPTPSA